MANGEANDLAIKKLQQWLAALGAFVALISVVVGIVWFFGGIKERITVLEGRFVAYQREQILVLQLLETRLRPIDQNVRSVVDSKIRQGDAAINEAK